MNKRPLCSTTLDEFQSIWDDRCRCIAKVWSILSNTDEYEQGIFRKFIKRKSQLLRYGHKLRLALLRQETHSDLLWRFRIVDSFTEEAWDELLIEAKFKKGEHPMKNKMPMKKADMPMKDMPPKGMPPKGMPMKGMPPSHANMSPAEHKKAMAEMAKGGKKSKGKY